MVLITFIILIILSLWLFAKWAISFFQDFSELLKFYKSDKVNQDKRPLKRIERIIKSYRKRTIFSILAFIIGSIFTYNIFPDLDRTPITSAILIAPILTLVSIFFILKVKRENVNDLQQVNYFTEEELDENLADGEEADLTLERKLLLSLLRNEGRQIANQHLWISEKDRWRELIFTILTQFVPLNHDDIRQITVQMSHDGLLEMKPLANLEFKNTKDFFNQPEIINMHAFFTEIGFTPELSKRSILCIYDAAAGFGKYYDSKIQEYMQSVGETILKDFISKFQFSELNKSQVKNAFVYWMQNVMNMPLSLNHDLVSDFAKQHGTTARKLFNEAENLDLNVAFLDDLIHLRIHNQSPIEEPI